MTHPLDVHEDPWHWLIVRPDGESVQEYTEDGHSNFSQEIERPIHAIVLVPQREGLKEVVLLIPDGARPIVFRSRSVTLVLDPEAPLPEHHRITGLGWQMTIDGRNYQTLLALYDDGSMVLTHDRNTVLEHTQWQATPSPRSLLIRWQRTTPTGWGRCTRRSSAASSSGRSTVPTTPP